LTASLYAAPRRARNTNSAGSRHVGQLIEARAKVIGSGSRIVHPNSHMFLILGTEHDPCCAAVRAALEARGRQVRIVPNVFAAPTRVSLRIDSHQTAVSCSVGIEPAPALEGVLVRGGAWIDPTGWEPGDLAYVQAETHAALLAWLRALPCPVVNRCPAGLWYRPSLTDAFWRPLVRAAGLRMAPAVVTNVTTAARAFAASAGARAAGGVVFGPMSTPTQYLVASEPEWSGVTALQARMPVALTLPHGAPDLVCVAGAHVIWNGRRPTYGAAIEPPLRDLAARAGLSFLEVALAESAGTPVVVSVEHNPRVDRFDPPAVDAIVAAVTDLLTGQATATEAAS
jgi:hypothetical protein